MGSVKAVFCNGDELPEYQRRIAELRIQFLEGKATEEKAAGSELPAYAKDELERLKQQRAENTGPWKTAGELDEGEGKNVKV